MGCCILLHPLMVTQVGGRKRGGKQHFFRRFHATAMTVLKNHGHSKHFPSSYAQALIWVHTYWQVIISSHSKMRNSLSYWLLIVETYSWALQWLCSLIYEWRTLSSQIYNTWIPEDSLDFLSWWVLGRTRINILATPLGEWDVRWKEIISSVEKKTTLTWLWNISESKSTVFIFNLTSPSLLWLRCCGHCSL